MADVADVLDALRERVQAVRDAEQAAGNPAFANTVVVRGWPDSASLDAATNPKDGEAAQAILTVVQREGMSRTDTRFPNEEHVVARPVPTITATVSGSTATFVGSGGLDQLAGVLVGSLGYSVRATGTPADTAAALAAIVPGAIAAGPSITAPGLTEARTAADAPTLRPTRQTTQGFAVCVWTNDPVQRDAIAGAVDAALSDVKFLRLADKSSGRLTYGGTQSSDDARDASLFKRELHYLVEYSTTIAARRTPVLFPGARVQGGQGVTPGVPLPPPSGPFIAQSVRVTVLPP